MQVEELNQYLSKLEGEGTLESLHIHKDILVLRIGGSVGGPYDDGEIEITFVDVEIINLPLSLMLPIKFSIADKNTTSKFVTNVNYTSEDRSLFLLNDDVGCQWHVYAGSYEVKVLPIFWKRP